MVKLNSAQEQVRKLTDTAKRESNRNRQNAHEHWLAAVAFSTELLGPTNPQTSFCIFNAGEALIKVRKGEEAISILRPHLRTMERIHGKSHYAVENLHQSLARAYKLIGLNVSQLTHWLAAAQSAEKTARETKQHGSVLLPQCSANLSCSGVLRPSAATADISTQQFSSKRRNTNPSRLHRT